ncbi:MAG: c-type cytochrome [Pseudomonadota bacterium]|nr:c-type cytochrome [Pseudomonadota bacterium]
MNKRVATLAMLAATAAAPAIAEVQGMVSGDPQAGEQLAGSCVACHGPGGDSAAPTFPKLAGQSERYLAKQLLEIQSGARPVPTMAGQLDGMSKHDLQDLAAYFSAQSGSGGAADPALVELGERVYRAGIAEKGIAACAACHSPTGVGNPLAGFPALSGQHAAYTVTQLQAFRSGERSNDPERIMRDNAELLSDREIEAVSSYVAGLRP